MSDLEALDLNALAQFRASDLLAAGAGVAPPAAPIQLELACLEFDPAQPRRRFREDGIDALSASIRLHGVLEPISVRSHPQASGRYIVNRGERRVRAARRAGLMSVPAFIDERIDPFAQAAENLHREDMSPFDLARFIREREQEGMARAEIARRLAKPRSFITEAAALIDAPEALVQAVEQGQVGEDVRTLYRLLAAWRRAPLALSAVVLGKLLGDGPVNRSNVDALLAQAQDVSQPEVTAPRAVTPSAVASGGRTVLVVEHDGRCGALRLKAQDSNVGEVRFGDGTRGLLPLAQLRPVCWATEEQK